MGLGVFDHRHYHSDHSRQHRGWDVLVDFLLGGRVIGDLVYRPTMVRLVITQPLDNRWTTQPLAENRIASQFNRYGGKSLRHQHVTILLRTQQN
jgi:hypothetical protein